MSATAPHYTLDTRVGLVASSRISKTGGSYTWEMTAWRAGVQVCRCAGIAARVFPGLSIAAGSRYCCWGVLPQETETALGIKVLNSNSPTDIRWNSEHDILHLDSSKMCVQAMTASYNEIIITEYRITRISNKEKRQSVWLRDNRNIM